MKAITLWQPWASLIWLAVHPDPEVRKLAKRIETRSWSTPYRGPLAIHAAARWVPDVVQWVHTHHNAKPIRWALKAAGYSRLTDLSLGAILCTTNLDWCRIITGDNAPLEPEQSYGDYTPGRWAWHLADVKALPEPIPCRGMQGLWMVPPEIEERLKGAGDAESRRVRP